MNTLFIPSQSRTKPLFVVVVMILLGGLAALSREASADPSSNSDALRAPEKWTLVSYSLGGKKAKPGERAPWISFKRHKLAGFSGVNTYGGSAIAKNDGTLRVGALMSTEIAGLPDRRRLEDAYMALLSKVTNWTVKGRTLILSDGTDQNQLIFTAS